MLTKWIKFPRDILIIALLVLSFALLVAGSILKQHKTSPSVCTSDFSLNYKINDLSVRSSGVLFMSVDHHQNLVFSVNGKVVSAGQHYIVNRSIYYKLSRSPSARAGEVRSLFLHSDRFPIDNAPDHLVNEILFGTNPQNGGQYKVGRINDDVIVIGSYFSPVFSCQLLTD